MPLISPCVGVIYPSREYPIIPGCPKTVWQPTISNRAGFLCHSPGESHSHCTGHHHSHNVPGTLHNHIFEDPQSLRGVRPRSCEAFQALWRRGVEEGKGGYSGYWNVPRGREGSCVTGRGRGWLLDTNTSQHIVLLGYYYYCFYNTNTMIRMHWTGTTLWEDSTEWMG